MEKFTDRDLSSSTADPDLRWFLSAWWFCLLLYVPWSHCAPSAAPSGPYYLVYSQETGGPAIVPVDLRSSRDRSTWQALISSGAEQYKTATLRASEPPLTADSTAEALADLKNWQASLLAVEADTGPFSEASAQLLLGTANAQRRLGRHEEAVGTLKRALHITRVTAGLHSPNQFAILDPLVDSMKQVGDWDAVSDRLLYRTRLARRQDAAWDGDLRDEYLRLGDWYLSSYLLQLGDRPFNDLINSLYAYEQLLNAGTRDDQPLVLAQRMVYLQRELLATARLALYPYLPGDTRAYMDSLDEERRFSTIEDSHVFHDRCFNDGARTIHQFFDRTREDWPSELVASLLLETMLGDWHRAVGSWPLARKHYLAAQELAASHAELSAPFNTLFRAPVLLPDAPIAASQVSTLQAPVVLPVRFTVSERGRALDVEILQDDQETDADLLGMARRALRGARFRPHMEGNETRSFRVERANLLLVDGVESESR